MMTEAYCLHNHKEHHTIKTFRDLFTRRHVNVTVNNYALFKNNKHGTLQKRVIL